MKKSYLFVYNPSLGTRDEVREFVSNCKLITTWRFELVASFFVVSEYSANEICKEIKEYFGEGKGKYIVTEMKGNYQGWLEERSWNVINDKKLPPKE